MFRLRTSELPWRKGVEERRGPLRAEAYMFIPEEAFNKNPMD
jgi:hypothetical protein